MFENVDGRTDGLRTDGRTTDARVTGILIAHLGAFGSGELKSCNSCCRNQITYIGIAKANKIVPYHAARLSDQELFLCFHPQIKNSLTSDTKYYILRQHLHGEVLVSVILCLLGNFACFSKINFFENSFRINYHQSPKQLGSRSGLKILSGLIMVQTVCKVYQQTKQVV